MNNDFKLCRGLCSRQLPLSYFPPDLPYCKACRRGDTAREREAIANVIKAIRKGKHTQPEIARYARLRGDELGEVLVELILERRQVRSEIVSGERRYFEAA